jgi:tyrosine-protein phosphatase SIW14
MKSKFGFALFLLFNLISGTAHAKLWSFKRVDEHVFRGSQPMLQSDFDILKANEIKTIVDLEMMPYNILLEKSGATRNNLNFYNIPIWALTRDIDTLRKQVDTALKIMTDPALQPVYVHCMWGRHRTSLVIAMYRMSVMHWTLEQTQEEMDEFHFKRGSIEYTVFKGLINLLTSYHPEAIPPEED